MLEFNLNLIQETLEENIVMINYSFKLFTVLIPTLKLLINGVNCIKSELQIFSKFLKIVLNVVFHNVYFHQLILLNKSFAQVHSTLKLILLLYDSYILFLLMYFRLNKSKNSGRRHSRLFTNYHAVSSDPVCQFWSLTEDIAKND